jgi:hypothetical protein
VIFSGVPTSAEPAITTQAPTGTDIRYHRTFGGVGPDQGFDILENSDGELVIVGSTGNYGSGLIDVWVLRTDLDGNLLSSWAYGGPADEEGISIIECRDGGYAIAGATRSYAYARYDAWLLRIDANGNVLWNSSFGGPGTDVALSVVECHAGGFALTGYTSSFDRGNRDVYLIRVDANGRLLWERHFGGVDRDYSRDLIECSDGGFAIVGDNGDPYLAPTGERDLWLIRTDQGGDMLWEQTFGGSNNETGNSIIECSEGGFLLSGFTESYGAGDADMWLLRLNSIGTVLWNQTLGDEGPQYGRRVVECQTGGFTVVGSTYPVGAGTLGGLYGDFWLVRCDSAGNPLWTRVFGGAEDDWCRSLVELSDGGFCITGYTFSFGEGDRDLWLLRVDDSPPPTLQIPGFSWLAVLPALVVALSGGLLRRKRSRP